MKTVLWVRHGESESNAGLPVHSVSSVALTPRGHEQARQFAVRLTEPPHLIVYSSYLRTRQTAEPTITRFPHVPHEEWPVHEFSFLPAEAYLGTTEQQRQPASTAYWERRDPHWSGGTGAESFFGLMQRIETTLQHLAQRPEVVIMIFCHGHYIRAMLWHLLASQRPDDPATMEAFYQFTNSFPTPNTGVIPLFHNPIKGWLIGRLESPTLSPPT